MEATIIDLSYGDVIRILDLRMFQRQRVFTLRGYCAKNGGSVEQSRARCIERNRSQIEASVRNTGLSFDVVAQRYLDIYDPMVALNACPTILAADPNSVDRSSVAEVQCGALVRIEGTVYEIKAPGPLDGSSAKLVVHA